MTIFATVSQQANVEMKHGPKRENFKHLLALQCYN